MRHFLVCRGTKRAHALGQAVTLAVALTPTLVLGQQPSSPFRLSYASIYRQLSAVYTQKKVAPQQAAPLVDALERLTTEEIQRRLNSTPGMSAADLSAGLNEDMVEAMFGQSMEERRKHSPIVSFVSALALRAGPERLYVVGFTTFDDGTTRNVIDGFREGPKGYSLAARAGEELDGHSIRLLSLDTSSAQEARFLAYGNAIGDAHTRLTCTLYAFDGRAFRALWRQSGLFQGSVEVKGRTVVLTYQDFERWRKATPPYFVRETYSVAPAGLALVSRQPTDTPPPPPWPW
jgi:hypothetical protein